MTPFTLPFTASAGDIDQLGHVNNAIWVQWIQAIGTAHWEAVAPIEHVEAYAWVVTRHEINYRGNVALGETVTGETWVGEPPRGARFDRLVRFVGEDGRMKVEARTTLAMVDRSTGRLARVPGDVAGPFLKEADPPNVVTIKTATQLLPFGGSV
ncbi:acyl-CoA thioesterase [Sphingomonas xinjiangensis]|uniref:Acyl-CoA thioester hydrolase n=1 Tax=Sphingomonas xinjiangensis TaxID=643568 RepID=A0A840YRF2_9SPHN|nr:acyl-CoA thioesterase [Sphingomonas xinjiangensis]MBB5712112.1 acyl-CoA thioester hydrolase [Sphingomonas xinjiangensis]